jgi:hypothetical protein
MNEKRILAMLAQSSIMMAIVNGVPSKSIPNQAAQMAPQAI